jgi:hypothetical protein
MNLSYNSFSFSPSSVTCFCIFCKRVTTFRMGLARPSVSVRCSLATERAGDAASTKRMRMFEVNAAMMGSHGLPISL